MEDLSKRRVFLLAGHAQTGKTSLSEAILFKTGTVNRLGKVDEGTTLSDYEEDEKERKSSINLSVLETTYKGHKLQFIDTPGYLDFIGEVITSARIVDFGIIVIDCLNGIEVGTEKVWEIFKENNLPCIFFINKLDNEDANFDKTVKEIKNNLTKKATPLCIFSQGEIKKGWENKDSEIYLELMELVAESDEKLLEKYLEKGTLDDNEFNLGLKKAVASANLFPIIGGVALDCKGVDLLLDIIVDFMPSPQVKNRQGKGETGEVVEIAVEDNGPLCAQVFKTIVDPFLGQISIFRVFRGRVLSNSEVFNSSKDIKDKIGQLYRLQGKQQIFCEAIYAGEIGAVSKLKDSGINDTLCDPKTKVVLPPVSFPPPTYSASIKPKTRQDEDKISNALSKMMLEDLTFHVTRDPQTKELLVSGMGELHISVIVSRMSKRYSANVEIGTPKVAYKETVTKSVKVQGKYKKQTGGRGQYGDVWIEVEPLERGKGFEFVDKIVGGAIPRNFIPSVEKGILKAMETGILAGYPVEDVRVTLFDGSYHPVDSSDIAFQIAGSMAFKKALEQANSVLLEPIMNVEIIVPEEFMGQITGDINSRRGRVLGMETKGKNQVVKALIPLVEMFKYASDLRSVTGGRGSYTMSFAYYEIVPSRIAQGIIEEAKRLQGQEV